MTVDDETARTVAKTYVPRYQKENWKVDADQLGMSQSEFIRTMVQAGRHGFDLERPEHASPNADPGGSVFEEQVLDALRRDVQTWDELVAKLSENMEERLDETLQELQQQNRIRYSGRVGGYTIADNDEN